jgi:hypothetical protein
MRGLDERIGSSAIVEGAYRAVQTIYLHQNKWIDLSRAVKYPADYPELRTVLEVLVEEAKAGRIIVPLTQTKQINNRRLAINQICYFAPTIVIARPILCFVESNNAE